MARICASTAHVGVSAAARARGYTRSTTAAAEITATVLRAPVSPRIGESGQAEAWNTIAYGIGTFCPPISRVTSPRRCHGWVGSTSSEGLSRSACRNRPCVSTSG